MPDIGLSVEGVTNFLVAGGQKSLWEDHVFLTLSPGTPTSSTCYGPAINHDRDIENRAGILVPFPLRKRLKFNIILKI
jgi:hypothetical protein